MTCRLDPVETTSADPDRCHDAQLPKAEYPSRGQCLGACPRPPYEQYPTGVSMRTRRPRSYSYPAPMVSRRIGPVRSASTVMRSGRYRRHSPNSASYPRVLRPDLADTLPYESTPDLEDGN